MLVIEKARLLALKLNNPARVLECIPSAKLIKTSTGVELVVSSHGPDEVKVLRNLGIKAPAPILHYYDWPGRFTPFDHQRLTAAFCTMNQRCLILNEIGTGKTQSALWAADYLMKTGMVRKVLVLSPLSTLERVWGDAVFMQFPHRKHVVLHGAAAKRLKLLNTDADFYIINHDGLPIIMDEAQGMFDLIIVDEAAVYRNAGTSRFKLFRRYLEKQDPSTRLWLMTGTPTPNAPTDAWTLARLVQSPHCPGAFTRFRDMVMEKVGMHRWLPRSGSTEIVKDVLIPAVRYTRDECFDLPPTMTQTRQVDLTPTQRTYYDKMVKSLVIDLAAYKVTGTVISAANEAVKLQKMVQIACGVAYDNDGNNIEIDCKPRVRAVEEVIEEAGEKVIVFVPLTGTLHFLERELSKRWSVAVVNGEVSSTKRNEIFQNFQNSPDPKVLLAHPATMAHGLTLTAASTVIWYGPITSNEQYVQANGRIERIGKRHTSNVVHIVATKLEQQMYRRLSDRQKMQGLLLDLIQRHTER
jgi:superfamily II DNA or RNA helicase